MRPGEQVGLDPVRVRVAAPLAEQVPHLRQTGVPAGRWMGRGLAALGLAPGEEVTEADTS
ncbi:hypothetical protein ACFXP3_30615 [Streptomyces sp. NPDC059096]|uniref:hypothetical protein n=1 Tax=Streptomyces sp. NPDC059096 TaxID=3346727 RepID=UPI0036B731E7